MVKKINSFEEYQNIIQQFKNYHFAQSEIFWKARNENNVKFYSFAYYKEGVLIGCTQVLIKNILKNKEILLLPFGPVMKSGFTNDDLKIFINEILGEINKENIIFVQINPYGTNLDESVNLTKSINQYRHADGTAFISLDRKPEELFADFRKDVKANIKKAEKNPEISIEISRSVEDYEKFWKMYENTQNRKGFIDNRKNLYKSFLDSGNAFIMSIKADNRIIASVYTIEFKAEKSLITFLSSTTDDGNKLKAPTYLRWKLINYASDNEYEKLDFFSVDKQLDGPSSFKMGFRGEILWFNDSFDYVLNRKLYFLYKIMNFFKK